MADVMNIVMADRIRIIIDTDEEVRLAVHMAATKADVSISELITSILRQHLAKEMAIAKEYVPSKKPKNGK